ncbi:MAG: tRNA preQ1(34) S-adenosylmethionine ribosyltransferase-isomerase QueA [Acidobacteria bacterium]|nr:tRNA preQ1(34) S-adenosylmethionine ribosyltransferase-isomerase QueA [Acidobacteriota bacterium]
MRLEEFDYPLPAELIAQYPARRRSDSRMLVVYRKESRVEDSQFRRLPEYLAPGEVLALNNSRVLPARLFGHRLGVKSQPIGKRNPKRKEYLSTEIEALLVRPLEEGAWEALVRPGRKVRTGERLIFEGSKGTLPSVTKKKSTPMEAEVLGRGEFGLRTLRFSDPASLAKNLERIGHVPLPPYIRRPDEQSDRVRYQTVYAKQPGSVAAPTAGLHFTRSMLAALQARGIERVEITLHVSLGTFQPIHAEEIAGHRLHPETFSIAPKAAAALNQALEDGRRIVAVGTTTVRTLEHVAAQHDGRIEPASGETELFIQPGFCFRVVGGLLTNFHLPRTTLLMLVAAFAGRELILAAYEHAVRQRYRFYSYGDCMLIL